MVEWNACAVATVEYNRERRVEHVAHWPIERRDVHTVDWRRYRGVDLVAGGPPCQPFSIGGKHRGDDDARDMWPQAIRAVREIEPDAFLFENVRGLMRPKFEPYLNAIVAGLARPARDLGYHTLVQQVNAADYGAPQKRHRVIIAGVRERGVRLNPLNPTHSRERMLWDQWVSGEYWHRHGIKRNLDSVPVADAALVYRLRKLNEPPALKAWVTVRDALVGLGKPTDRDNHVFQYGARIYKGHTGSLLDGPAKALKAGDHGVPGGENMMVMDDGGVRYFTIREAARLQGLPDEYQFPRSWSESMRQLGNAVPVQLAEAVGGWLLGYLGRDSEQIAAAA
jgi:DNA (cytosine-5)-methyltransferase 1